MKLTPWYPGHVKPVRVGVYERQYADKNMYCLWKANKWRFPATTAKKAAIEEAYSFTQSLPWRGIAKEPK